MGAKARPFYRIVVAKSSAGRDGAFVEVLGTYDPLRRPSVVKINGARALEWLLSGAQPTETVAYLLKREGILEEFFAARPKAKAQYKFLDKRIAVPTAATVPSGATMAESAQSAAPEVDPAPEIEPEPAHDEPAVVPEAGAAEPIAEPQA
jgi:small subunit ribosomal protein S16